MNFLVDEKNSEFVCGRPLGLAFDTVGDNLIVMDTSSGIFELNLKSLERKKLVPADAIMGGSVRTRNKKNLIEI